jgi:hypothetical protein
MACSEAWSQGRGARPVVNARNAPKIHPRHYNARVDKVVFKTTLKGAPEDRAYWLAQPVAARLAALEQLRQQWSAHLPDAQQRLQRVHQLAQLHGR